MKIIELNHRLLHIHTLELSKHAFSTRWLKNIKKNQFNSKKQGLFDKIIQLVTTPRLKKIKIFIEKRFVPRLDLIPESIDGLELIINNRSEEIKSEHIKHYGEKLAIKNLVIKV
jgi:hypothetical protein